MARKRFTLADLPKLDFGRVDGVFQAKLGEILDDIDKRPLVTGNREISLTMKVAPADGDGGKVETVSVAYEIKTKVPGLRSRDYAMQLTEAGLVFNDQSPDDPNQHTLDEELERNRKAD